MNGKILLLLLVLYALGTADISALDFQNRTSGIAQAGMGLAGIAYPDPLNAPYWNPANLNYAYTNQLGATYYQRLESIQHFSFDTILALPRAYPISFSFLQESIDNIPETNDIGGEGVKVGSFSDASRFYSLASAMPLSSGTILGGTIKLHTHDLHTYNATGYAGDLGIVHKIHDNATVGITARNVVSDIEWSTGTHETFEKTLATGLYVQDKLGTLPLGVVADYELNLNNAYLNAWYLGAEAWIVPDHIAFRAGTNILKDLTVGMGMRYYDFLCDAAYIIKDSDTKFGNEFLFSSSFMFTMKKNTPTQPEKENAPIANTQFVKASYLQNHQAYVTLTPTENLAKIAVMDVSRNVSYYTPDINGNITFPAQSGEYTLFIQQKDETVSKERILL